MNAGIVTIVQDRRARSTGARITVAHYGGHSWATVCETHGSYADHYTRAAAVSWAASPETWCQQCETIQDGGRS